MWLYMYTVCVHAGQWPVGWGALAFDLELRGQAADGQPAGHFHLKDPKDPSAHPHTHTLPLRSPPFLLVSHFLLVWMVGWFMSAEKLQPFISP